MSYQLQVEWLLDQQTLPYRRLTGYRTWWTARCVALAAAHAVASGYQQAGVERDFLHEAVLASEALHLQLHSG